MQPSDLRRPVKGPGVTPGPRSAHRGRNFSGGRPCGVYQVSGFREPTGVFYGEQEQPETTGNRHRSRGGHQFSAAATLVPHPGSLHPTQDPSGPGDARRMLRAGTGLRARFNLLELKPSHNCHGHANRSAGQRFRVSTGVDLHQLPVAKRPVTSRGQREKR